MAPGVSPLELRIAAPPAPVPTDLEVRGIPQYTLPVNGYCFDFTVLPREGAPQPPEFLEALPAFLERHVEVIGVLEGESDDGGVQELEPLRCIVSRGLSGVRIHFVPIDHARGWYRSD